MVRILLVEARHMRTQRGKAGEAHVPGAGVGVVAPVPEVGHTPPGAVAGVGIRALVPVHAPRTGRQGKSTRGGAGTRARVLVVVAAGGGIAEVARAGIGI